MLYHITLHYITLYYIILYYVMLYRAAIAGQRHVPGELRVRVQARED